MDFGLQGKRALITAASEGLGFGCAEMLAKEGARVVIVGRDSGRLAVAKCRLESVASADIAVLACDLSKRNELAGLVHRAESAIGALDVLVVSTGHPPTYPFSEATDQHWQDGVELLLWPAVTLARQVLPGMRARGFGRIIFIGSIFGLEPEQSSVVQSTLRLSHSSLRSMPAF